MIRIAIDGGATKTVAALYDDKNIISIGVSGPSNYRYHEKLYLTSAI